MPFLSCGILGLVMGICLLFSVPMINTNIDLENDNITVIEWKNGRGRNPKRPPNGRLGRPLSGQSVFLGVVEKDKTKNPAVKWSPEKTPRRPLCGGRLSTHT